MVLSNFLLAIGSQPHYLWSRTKTHPDDSSFSKGFVQHCNFKERIWVNHNHPQDNSNRTAAY